jgi:hypothetical protein
MRYQQRILKQKLANLSEVNTNTAAFTHNANRASALHTTMRKKVAALDSRNTNTEKRGK